MSAVPKGYKTFSYFDQFKDMEIDLTDYLAKASTEKFDYKLSNIQPVVVKVKNLFEQFRILDTYKRDIASFNRYDVKDNEKLEDISQRFYETRDFWWIITVFNDIRNPFLDLPLSEDQLVELAGVLTDQEKKYPKSVYYKLLFEANEKKRQILVPKKAYIADIIWSYRQAIYNEENS